MRQIHRFLNVQEITTPALLVDRDVLQEATGPVVLPANPSFAYAFTPKRRLISLSGVNRKDCRRPIDTYI